jgi:hypothetical protein
MSRLSENIKRKPKHLRETAKVKARAKVMAKGLKREAFHTEPWRVGQKVFELYRDVDEGDKWVCSSWEIRAVAVVSSVRGLTIYISPDEISGEFVTAEGLISVDCRDIFPTEDLAVVNCELRNNELEVPIDTGVKK